MAKKLAEYSEAELKTVIKTLTGLLIVMGVVALAYAGYYAYLYFNDKLNSSNMIGLIPLGALLVTGLPSLININNFRAELARRKHA